MKQKKKPTKNETKQEANGPHHSPEQEFFVLFYFVLYVFPILNNEPRLGPQLWSKGHGFYNIGFSLYIQTFISI